MDHTSSPSAAGATFDWRTISALNAVSTLAQIGQFGFVYVVLPVWMADQGFSAARIGLFATTLWVGQLLGLALAPRLNRVLGARRVVVLGLGCTLAALPCIAGMYWPAMLAGGLLSGLGLGLRWIGLEPWLYGIAPEHARGRLVGFHETLIALAPVLAPLMAGYVAMRGSAVFALAGVFVLLALLPLLWTRRPAPVATPPHAMPLLPRLHALVRQRAFRQGMWIAGFGGMLEAALAGLFAVYSQGRGLGAVQTAELLAVFGLGGLVLQYPVGWCADHFGVRATALLCALATAAVALVLALPLGYAAMLGAMAVLGGVTTAFLTLAMVAGTQAGGNLSSKLSAMSMLYTLSAVAGPALAGVVVTALSGNALMVLVAGMAGAMVLALALDAG